MITLKIDENNNLMLDKRNLAVHDGIYAYAQDARTRIGICKGEDPLQVLKGIDWLQGKYNQEQLSIEIRDRIRDSQETVNVPEVLITKIKDGLQVDTSIMSIYGKVNL